MKLPGILYDNDNIVVFEGEDEDGNKYRYMPFPGADNSDGRVLGPAKRRFHSIPIRVLARQNVAEYEPPLTDYEESERPKTRGDCENGMRPCPWASCRHHLFLDVDDLSGSLKINFPGEIEDMPHTCALDIADNGPNRLIDVGATISLTRERVRQLEEKLLRKVRQKATFAELKANSKR